MDILIIGGSRFVGPLLVERLMKHNLTIFNRGRIAVDYPEGVEFIKGDRDGKFEIEKKFDAVVDMCAYEGAQTAKALEELDTDFFVHVSTAAAYKKSNIFPLTEDSPLGSWPLWGEYNRGKVECEEVLAGSGVKYASIRPVYILGPKNYAARESFIYSRLLQAKEITLPGNGQALAQFVFADEVADSLVRILEKKADGAFNCCGDDLVTLEGLVELMAGVCDRKAKTRSNPKTDGDKFDGSEFPFANENMICSNSRIKSLGIVFRGLGDGLEQDYLSHYGPILNGK